MSETLKNLPLCELRQLWANAWGRKPHARIGRSMLERSLEYKIYESSHGLFTGEQATRLTGLIKQYKNSPYNFDKNQILKTGTRLVRLYSGVKHTVLVKTDGFEYGGKNYTSLSKIANDITGKNWNGWVFFGLKKVVAK